MGLGKKRCPDIPETIEYAPSTKKTAEPIKAAKQNSSEGKKLIDDNMKAYPNYTKEQVIDALKKRGYLE